MNASPTETDFRTRLGTVALLLVFALLIVLSVRQVGDPDVGFHLKTGEYILDGNGWPANDPFTYTLGDRPYVDTSWGYDVLIAAVQRLSGSPGLVLFHACLVFLAFFMLRRSAGLSAADPLSLAGCLLLGVMASELRFEARPELVSYLLLALVLHLLHRWALGLPSPLWLLPLIHLVWANCHSLFILGWVALGCFWAGGWIRNRRPDRALLGWGLASAAVAFISPYGWRGVAQTLTLATRLNASHPFARSIGEYAPPFALPLSDQFPFYPRLAIFSFAVLVILSAAALWALIRRKRWDLFLLLLAFLIPALGMVRNMPLLVIAATPGLVWALPAQPLLRRIGRGETSGRRLRSACLAAVAAVSLLLGLRVFHDAHYIDSRLPSRFGLGWNRLVLPLDAADFAVRAGLTGRVLNHLNLGGTLLWKLPQPIFIDGRLEVVGESFYVEYSRMLESEQALEAAVERYGIQWLVFPYAINGELLGRLSRDSRWRLAYVDPLAVIFVRVGAGADAVVDPALSDRVRSVLPAPRFGALPGLGGPPRRGTAGRWLAGLVRREKYPDADFNLGLFHFFRGEPVRAERRFARALAESRGAYYEIYADLAASLYWQRRVEEARACDRVVLQADPGNRLARERLSRGHP